LSISPVSNLKNIYINVRKIPPINIKNKVKARQRDH
jgi:hypothetical protein